jgi:diacylglycerol kinase family enzyme
MHQAHPVIQKRRARRNYWAPERIVFIVNPKAGTNLQKHIRDQRGTRHLDHRKRFIYGIWHTERAGHAAELARKARSKRATKSW